MDKEKQIGYERLAAVSSGFDTAIEWLLGSLLVFMPLLFGARSAWTEEVVIALSGCIVVLFLLKLIIFRNQAFVWSWTYLTLGLFLLIVLFQLIPIPSGLLNMISPNTVSLKSELLSGLPGADKLLRSMTISLYPNSTEHDLRLLFCAAAVFVVVLNVFNRPNQIKRLIMVIALTGGLVSIIALTQDLFGNGLRYWFVSHPYSDHYRTNSGPFINHNHYGQFMNLSIGAAIGWLCMEVHERFSDRHFKSSEIVDYLACRKSRILWFLVIMMGLGAATVFISLTRGGMLSLLVAGFFTTLMLVSRKSMAGRGWMMVVMALGALACVIFVGFDAVYDRFATLQNFDGYESRWQTLKDLVASFGDFPFLGTGLGTHSVVYPMYQNINSTALFTHAENEYAQVLEEVGVIGLALLTVFGVNVWSCYFRNIRTAKLPIQSAAYGLGFGLLAILIHSFSDYGQHVPANIFLSAVFCALLIVLSRQGNSKYSAAKSSAYPQAAKYSRLIVLLCTSGVFIWILFAANNARVAEYHWRRALAIEKNLEAENWQGTEAVYSELISHAKAAVINQPDNGRYRYAYNLYRWYSITKSNESCYENAESFKDSMPLVRDVVSGFNEAIQVCPTYGPSHCLTGQIEKFIFEKNSGAEKIRRGFKLAPCDPMVCFVAGRLDILEGKPGDSISKFEKAVTIDGRFFGDVAKIYINYLSRPYLAVLAAGDDIGRLRHLARLLDDMQYDDLAEQCRQEEKRLLEIKCKCPDAVAGDFASLASIYIHQKENDKAIEYYRRALELDYGQVYWRYSLAKVLAESNRIPEALYEARICVRIRPQYNAAKKLVAAYSVDPASFQKTD